MVLNICSKFNGNIFDGLGYRADTVLILKITKRWKFTKMYVKLRFMFSAYRLTTLYTCTKSHENTLNSIGQEFSILKLQRDIITQEMNMELIVFFYAQHRMMFYICSKFHENVFDCFEVIEQTLYSY